MQLSYLRRDVLFNALVESDVESLHKQVCPYRFLWSGLHPCDRIKLKLASDLCEMELGLQHDGCLFVLEF